jgi:uncharacterized protein YdhG (YjbR/CyaY superfamily)
MIVWILFPECEESLVKTQPPQKRAGAKNSSTEVDRYLEAVPEPARGTLQKVRAAIRSAAPPDATEAIGYGMPTFRYKKALMGYAAFAKHCGLFPMSAAVLAELRDELSGYETSKGGIRFPLDKPLPAGLIQKLVKARLAEIEGDGKLRSPRRSPGVER